MIDRFFQPLRRRLLLLFALALVVPVAFGISTAIERYRDAVATARDAAQNYAVLASNYEVNLLWQAQQITEALRDDPAVRAALDGTPSPSCNDAMARSVSPYPHFSSVSLFDLSGAALCQWDPAQPLPNVSERRWFREAVATGTTTISGVQMSQVINEPVIAYALPVVGTDGRARAVIGLGLRIKWLEAVGQEPGLPADGEVSLLDRDGLLLVSSHKDAGARRNALPDASLMANISAGRLHRFEAPGLDGVQRLYAVNAMAGNSLIVLFGQPKQAAIGRPQIDLAVQIGTLCLMTLAGLLTAGIAGRLLVTRWTGKLMAAAKAMELGNLSADTEWQGAPREIHDLADTLQAMARGIERRESALRESVEQKQLMLREVHHRVKNNLQIVTSLLSLHQRQMKGEIPARAFAELQLRIKTLALVHRHLYESDSLGDIDMAPLMQNLCALLADDPALRSRQLTVEADLQAFSMSGDQAIPLTLLTTELIARIARQGYPDGGPGRIVVRLAREQGEPREGGRQCELTIAHSGRPVGLNDMQDSSDTLSGTLISAFTRQVGGSFQTETGSAPRHRLNFPVRATVAR